MAIRPYYSSTGQEEFRTYAAPDSFRQRNAKDHAAFIAEADGLVTGMVHLKQFRHVAMLFVRREHHRQGVGRALLKLAARYVVNANSAPRAFTVNSSPNAVHAYQQMGFQALGPEQEIRGIRFIPMQCDFGSINLHFFSWIELGEKTLARRLALGAGSKQELEKFFLLTKDTRFYAAFVNIRSTRSVSADSDGETSAHRRCSTAEYDGRGMLR